MKEERMVAQVASPDDLNLVLASACHILTRLKVKWLLLYTDGPFLVAMACFAVEPLTLPILPCQGRTITGFSSCHRRENVENEKRPGHPGGGSLVQYPGVSGTRDRTIL
jgi:hypothetical protein